MSPNKGDFPEKAARSEEDVFLGGLMDERDELELVPVGPRIDGGASKL